MINGEYMYVILGSNKLATDVVEELQHLGKESKMIHDLGELNTIDNVETLLIFEEIELEENYDFPVVLYHEDHSDVNEKCADILLTNTGMISSVLVAEVNRYNDMKSTAELITYLEQVERELSVFLHDNPDPDAIASAMAFEEICKRFDKECVIYYYGDIGHPENELFVETTGVNLKQVSSDEIPHIIEENKPLVFIDFSKAGINNSLPINTYADVVIDHHPSEHTRIKDGYIQVEQRAGATSTLLTEHLINSDINIQPILASALLHGIKVDTNGFIRNISKSDFKAMYHLNTLCDKELLEILERSPMNPSTMSSLGTAIINRDISVGVLTSYAGVVSCRDDIPQIVDILVTERDVHSAIVFGKIDNKIHISARSQLTNINIGDILENAFSDIGEAGGHPHAAAGVISVKEEVFDTEVIKELSKRFRREVIKHE